MMLSYSRMALAALGGFVTYFVIGGLSFALLPLAKEFARYPAVYRSKEGIQSTMPAGMAAMFVSILALAALYALQYRTGSGAWEGARFGALIGVFAAGAFVVHNYVNLNIGVKLTLQQGVMYFLEWVAPGVVIGLIYRPAAGS